MTATIKDYDYRAGTWATLAGLPCIVCHEPAVVIRVDEAPIDCNQPQVVRCERCGKTWEPMGGGL